MELTTAQEKDMAAAFRATVLAGFMMGLVSEAAGQSTTMVADEINVAAGDTLMLKETRHLSWYLDTLVIGDGATLQLSPETKVFFLRVHNARIGVGTKIIGTGSLGHKGRDGENISSGHRVRGGDGNEGGAGGDGPTITLVIQDKAKFESLTVEAAGGKGGLGGIGGVGSPSHKGLCVGRGAIDSGDAGNGGSGGKGGRGGTVMILLPESVTERTGLDRKIDAIANGGPGGDGGGERQARPGARPVDCGFFTRGGSRRGARGLVGSEGNQGEPGLTEIRFVDFHTAALNPVDTIGEQLRRLMKMLQEHGYEGNADALAAVLKTPALSPNLLWRQPVAPVQ